MAIVLVYVELAVVGLLIAAIPPVLLTMGAAAFAPMVAALKRVALGFGRRPALTERTVDFEHLPAELASLGTSTLMLLEELDRFAWTETTTAVRPPQQWWRKIGAAFEDPSAYQAEARTTQEVWQWVFAAERLPTDRLEELRTLGIGPARVRAELLSSTSFRAQLPALLIELERVTDTLAGYSGTDYRGRSIARPVGPARATDETRAETDQLRRKRYHQIERRYARELRRIAARHSRSSADRDDLLQDIRLAIWNALPSYRGESTLRTYAIRIAHKRAASALRKSLTPRVVPDLSTALPQLDEQLESAARGGWLTRAIAQLSPGVAEALERRLSGESYKEIADALGITTSNVGVRLHTGKAKLRALAADDNGVG